MRFVWMALALVLACGDSGPNPNGEAVGMFTLPRTGEEPFFDLPWPNDVRRADGFIDVRGFRNPRNIELLNVYSEAISTRLEGYSVSAPAFLRFGTAIDESTLPQTPLAAMEPGSSVFIMNVDDSSGGVGSRHPVVLHYWDPETSIWPGHALAVRPVHGVPLQPETTYAVVVTRAVIAADGRELEPSDDLAALLDRSLNSDPAIDAAAEIYEPALDVLADNGVPRTEILNMAVFTTQDPVGDLIAARDWLVRQPPPEPVAEEWRWVRDDEDGYTLVHGAYPSPIFQSGELPYLDGGGEVTIDAAGDPVVHGTYNARFSLTIPNGEVPENGWPVVLYAHGTGGDFESSLGVAGTLASVGVATMGVDQIHHGTRNPTESGPEALVFNFINPFAFRDNNKQAALDVVQQARFIINNQVSDRVIADPPGFDADNVFFMGHSQGGINGPLFLAVDDQARGGVLSGAGAHLPIALVEKTEPLSIADLVRLLLRLSPSESMNEHLVYEHPIFALMQTWADSADPNNYAHMFFENPREGFAPKSILQTEGTTDAFSPPRGIEALAAAGRIPLLMPELHPVEGLDVLGVAPIAGPVVGNVAGGQATAGLIQYNGGHFVAFGERAQTTISGFFGSWVSDGLPSIAP